MICLFAHRSSYLGSATSILEPRYQVDQKKRWSQFRSMAPRRDCGIAIVPRLNRGRFVGHLTAFRHRHPLEPLVLVTRAEADNVRLTRRIRLDEIVWLGNMDERLRVAVHRAGTDVFFRRQARRFEGAEHLPSRLQRALVLACRCEQPIRSVGRLAEAVGCDRRTLWRQWRKTTSEGQLKDLLSWLQLLQAVGQKTRGRSARAAAQSLGLNEKSLAPLAKRLTGQPFAELAANGRESLLERFRNEMKGEMFDRIPDRDIFG